MTSLTPATQMHAVRRRSLGRCCWEAERRLVPPKLRSSDGGNARLGAEEVDQRGDGACGAPARGVARITSSKIHARSDRGNRGRAYVIVVQHISTHKFESFSNCHAARAAATFLGATPHGVCTHINVANALKVRRGCRLAQIGMSIS